MLHHGRVFDKVPNEAMLPAMPSLAQSVASTLTYMCVCVCVCVVAFVIAQRHPYYIYRLG